VGRFELPASSSRTKRAAKLRHTPQAGRYASDRSQSLADDGSRCARLATSAAETAAGTLSEVLRGTVPGRRTEAERTIYTPVGLPGQDLAPAWAAYQQGRRAGRGLEYDFLA
jgi:ornithine cyclodeaminase/alanine dehydrogenase-like protein (mu-crystallin family)